VENHAEALRRQADCCRRLAESIYDRNTSEMLRQLADRFDRSADELKKDG
jgi:hypothetical protein